MISFLILRHIKRTAKKNLYMNGHANPNRMHLYRILFEISIHLKASLLVRIEERYIDRAGDVHEGGTVTELHHISFIQTLRFLQISVGVFFSAAVHSTIALLVYFPVWFVQFFYVDTDLRGE